MADNKKVTYEFPSKLVKELKIQAIKEDITQKDLLIKIITQYLKDNS